MTNISLEEVFIGLLLSVALGMLLGIERNLAGKVAGMRTYALVSMGSALFIEVSRIVSSQFIDLTNFDPLRVASQVVVGIGFLGAGILIFKGGQVTGLTTAAGLWVAAGVGMTCGFGLYLVALFAAGLTLFIFTAMWVIERDYVNHWHKKVEKKYIGDEKK